MINNENETKGSAKMGIEKREETRLTVNQKAGVQG